MAYGCYACITFLLCAIALALSLPLQLDLVTSQVLGMLVLVPVVIATLAVVLAALILSIIQWREWPLLIMLAANASILLLAFLGEDEWKVIGEDVAIAWSAGAIAVLLFFSVRWFAFTRRRLMQMRETEEQSS